MPPALFALVILEMGGISLFSQTILDLDPVFTLSPVARMTGPHHYWLRWGRGSHQLFAQAGLKP
jgi:hypothetical protein